MIRKSTLFVVLFALCSFMANAASGLFIRGGFTNWNAVADWEFTEESNGVYTLKDKTVFGKFKIADSGWTEEWGAPSATSVPELGKDFTLAGKGQNTDIDLGDTAWNCTEITLTKTVQSTTIKFVGTVEGSDTPIEAVYVIGDNNAWDFNDTTGKLIPTENEGEFSGRVKMLNAAEQEVGYWRIYENLGQRGVWGITGGNLSGNNLSGTLVRGGEDCVTTAAGDYTFTFNINTGAFSIAPYGASVAELNGDTVTVTGGDDMITVSGANSVSVYTIGGALVSENEATISVPAGLYVVLADGKAHKVAVK